MTDGEVTNPKHRDLFVWEKKGVEKEGFTMEWSGLGDHANPNVDHILACIEITYVLCVRHNLRFIPKFIFSKNP